MRGHQVLRSRNLLFGNPAISTLQVFRAETRGFAPSNRFEFAFSERPL